MHRLMLVALVLAPVPLAAQEPFDSAAAAQMRLAQPGPEHERLSTFAGEWQATLQMGGMTITADVENRMILGGRFLESRVTGAGGGMPFEYRRQ